MWLLCLKPLKKCLPIELLFFLVFGVFCWFVFFLWEGKLLAWFQQVLKKEDIGEKGASTTDFSNNFSQTYSWRVIRKQTNIRKNLHRLYNATAIVLKMKTSQRNWSACGCPSTKSKVEYCPFSLKKTLKILFFFFSSSTSYFFMTVSIYNSRRPLTFMNSVTIITCVIGSGDRTAYNIQYHFLEGEKNTISYFQQKD